MSDGLHDFAPLVMRGKDGMPSATPTPKEHAPVTEEHRKLYRQLCGMLFVDEITCTETEERGAQLLADALASNGPTCHKCGKLVETGDVLCSEHEQEVLKAVLDMRLAEARLETLEEVCRVLCIGCRNGWVVARQEPHLPLEHFDYGPMMSCDAMEIRKLMSNPDADIRAAQRKSVTP